MGDKKSRKEQLLKELQDLENEKLEGSEDLGIQRGKDAVEEEAIEDEPQPVLRVKKPRTDAQIKAFEKAKETARLNAEKRKAERDLVAQQEQKVVEEKLVKKAIAVKKKQIKKQAILDEIEDDDTPLEEIEKIVKKLPAKKVVKEVNLPTRTAPSPYTFY
jgi:hypothetical protein